MDLRSRQICGMRFDILIFLSRQPIEHGFSHPAEDVIRVWIDTYGPKEFVEFWEEQLDHSPGIAADILFCLSALPSSMIDGWGHDLAARALVQPSLSVRNAAVETLERWGDGKSYDILKASNERVPWLRNYIDRVLSEYTV